MRQTMVEAVAASTRRFRVGFSLTPSVPSPSRGRGNGRWSLAVAESINPYRQEKTAPVGRQMGNSQLAVCRRTTPANC